MDTSLIIMIVGFLVLVWLIFKFVKKIVTAIFTILLLLVVIFAGAYGLIYFDFKSLSSEEVLDIQILHSKDDAFLRGVSIPLRNGELEFEELKGMSSEFLASFDPKSTEAENSYHIVIEDEFFQILMDKDEFSSEDLAFGKYTLELSKTDLEKIVDTKSSGDLADILLESTDLTGNEKKVAKINLANVIDKELGTREIDTGTLMFLLVLADASEDPKSLVQLTQAFKDKDLRVYPSRFSFTLVRMLPSGTILNLLDVDEEDQEESEE